MQPDCLNYGRQAVRGASNIVIAALIGAIDVVRNHAERLAPRSAGTNHQPQRPRDSYQTSIQLQNFSLPRLCRIEFSVVSSGWLDSGHQPYSPAECFSVKT